MITHARFAIKITVLNAMEILPGIVMYALIIIGNLMVSVCAMTLIVVHVMVIMVIDV